VSPQEALKRALVDQKNAFDALLVQLEAQKSLLQGTLPILSKGSELGDIDLISLSESDQILSSAIAKAFRAKVCL